MGAENGGERPLVAAAVAVSAAATAAPVVLPSAAAAGRRSTTDRDGEEGLASASSQGEVTAAVAGWLTASAAAARRSGSADADNTSVPGATLVGATSVVAGTVAAAATAHDANGGGTVDRRPVLVPALAPSRRTRLHLYPLGAPSSRPLRAALVPPAGGGTASVGRSPSHPREPPRCAAKFNPRWGDGLTSQDSELPASRPYCGAENLLRTIRARCVAYKLRRSHSSRRCYAQLLIQRLGIPSVPRIRWCQLSPQPSHPTTAHPPT